MTRRRVFCTDPFFEAPRTLLAESVDVEYWDGSDRPPRAEVLRRIADKDALICLLTEKIDEELLCCRSAPRHCGQCSRWL